ncbi:cohesin domain-containing protein [Patescibacteria group bacterium]
MAFQKIKNEKRKMKNYHSKTKINLKFLAAVFAFSFLFFGLMLAEPATAASASLYLSPPSGTYIVDSTFPIKIKVNSGGDAVNAAEGTLIFNPNELSVISLSKNESIFNLWTAEPTFSNSTGNIFFGGGTPSSFVGNSGTIVTITFKAKGQSSAQVGFSSGSILAADGKGTNVLVTMNGGVYTLSSQVITPPAEEVPPESEYIPPTVPGGAPAAPVISSVTHPNPDKWYSNDDPEFNWKVPGDVTGVKLLINKIPTTLPTVSYKSPILEKKINDLTDGAWYFHVRFANQYGWGGISHRKVLIDTEAPDSFEIEIDTEGDLINPVPILKFKAKDLVSGIDFYEIKIDERVPEIVTPQELAVQPYRMPSQEPGKYSVTIKAVDMAGNFTFSSKEITIEAVEPPVITSFPEKLQEGDLLSLEGTSLSDYTVLVYVQKEQETPFEREVKTDEQGNWSYTHEQSVKKGVYNVWAKNKNPKGALSYPTQEITIAVDLPALLQFGKIAIDYLTMITTLIVLIVGAGIIIFYGWYRVSLWRKRLRKETGEVKDNVVQSFKALREEVRERVEYLDEKPGLTKKEREVRDKLQEALDICEKFISKEIEDVEKELE